MYRHYDYYKYYKITDITNYSNNYILVCQSNAERKLQNYNPYKHLYNQHMKKTKKYNLTNITKNSWSKNFMHGILQAIQTFMFWTINIMRKENYKITNLTSIYTINT